MYGPGPVEMYGVARASFVVKGAVTDDDKPLENIRVVLKIKNDETNEHVSGAREFRDTVYTDKKGEFQTASRPTISVPLELIATDVDGAENGGEFESRSEEFNANGGMDYEEGHLVKKIDFVLTVRPQDDEK